MVGMVRGQRDSSFRRQGWDVALAGVLDFWVSATK